MELFTNIHGKYYQNKSFTGFRGFVRDEKAMKMYLIDHESFCSHVVIKAVKNMHLL